MFYTNICIHKEKRDPWLCNRLDVAKKLLNMWTTDLMSLWFCQVWQTQQQIDPTPSSSVITGEATDSCVCEQKEILRVKVLFAQSCPTLCNPMDCSPPGSSTMGFFRKEHWSGLPCPPPGDLPDPSESPTLQAESSPSEPPGSTEWSWPKLK